MFTNKLESRTVSRWLWTQLFSALHSAILVFLYFAKLRPLFRLPATGPCLACHAFFSDEKSSNQSVPSSGNSSLARGDRGRSHSRWVIQRMSWVDSDCQQICKTDDGAQDAGERGEKDEWAGKQFVFDASIPSIAQCVHCTVFFPLDRARSDLS